MGTVEMTARDGPQSLPKEIFSAPIPQTPATPPERKNARKRTRKTGPKNSPKSRNSHSGTGSNLPAVAGVDWERNSSGGWEAWHVPPGAIHRKDKTYLGYAGKKLLANWESLSPAAARSAAEAWAEQKRLEKGISNT